MRINRRISTGLLAAFVSVAGSGIAASASHAPPIITSPPAGAAVGSSTVSVRGTAAGDLLTIEVWEGVTLRASVTQTEGQWVAGVALPDGAHTLHTVGRDAANVASSPSDPVTFTVDTVSPGAAVITQPADGAVLTDATITVEGLAEPGARIEVAISTGVPFYATTNGSGEWRVTRIFTSTSHTLVATAIDPAGNRSSASPPTRITVDLIDPGAPVVYTPGEGQELNTSTLDVSGSAEPGATVTLSEGSVIATVTVASDGTWRSTLPFSHGSHALHVRTTDMSGRVGPPTYRTFFVDLIAPPQPMISTPGQDAVVANATTFTGVAEAGARVDLLPGNTHTSVAHAFADRYGYWTITKTVSHGYQEFRVRAQDQAGNRSPESDLRTFKADGDSPTVQITTREGALFLPGSPMRIEGTASDGIGVFAVELQFYDLLGKALPYRYAACGDCPGSSAVNWVSTWAPPTGRYIVKAIAIDRVGHRSEVSSISIVKL